MLLALGLVVYFQVRDFEFLNWDDPAYVRDNAAIGSGLTSSAFRWAFDNTASPNWHPLTWLSHALDVSLFGLTPGPHHLDNVGWHLATVIGIFWLLRALTDRAGRSFVVAALFAVHPLHVESVAWIAERKDVLSACLAVATIGAYARAVRVPTVGRKVAVFVLFCLALMAKPMVVTLPALLLVLDFWPLRRFADVPVRQLLLEKIPLLIPAVADTVVTIRMQAAGGAMAGLGEVSLLGRSAQAISAYVCYLWQAMWPGHLAAYYPLAPVSPVAIVGAAIVLVALSSVAIYLRGRAPYLLAGWLWFLISLAPVIGILQAGGQAHADRYMYLALLGPLIAAVWGISDLFARQRAPSWIGASISAAAAASFAFLAHAQAATWVNSETLWEHSLAVTGPNSIASDRLGAAYASLGRLDAAKRMFEEALATSAGSTGRSLAVVHNDLGLVLARQEQPDAAAAEFRKAIDLDAASADGHVNLGNTLAAEGHFPQAAVEFTAALQLDAALPEAEIGLGNIAVSEGRAAQALSHYDRAIALNPRLADALNGLGSAYIEVGQPERALEPLRRALDLRPDSPSAAFNMAVALVKLGRTSEARGHLEAVLLERPNFDSARHLLAQINGR